MTADHVAVESGGVKVEHSVETRWMVPGMPPDDLQDQIAEWGDVERRTDVYLTPADDESNVKFRNGRRLEIKRRRWWRRCDLSLHLVARVEGWTKWTFPEPDGDFAELANTPGWVPVDKSRWVLGLGSPSSSPNGSSTSSRNGTSTSSRNGEVPEELHGHLEVSVLGHPAEARPQWTLGVEIPTSSAQSADDAPIAALVEGLQLVERRLDPDDLFGAAPASYPAWLRGEDAFGPLALANQR